MKTDLPVALMRGKGVQRKPEAAGADSGGRQAESHHSRRVTNWSILPTVAGRTARSVVGGSPDARRLLKHLWIEAKRYSATNVRNVQVEDIAGLKGVTVTGGVSRYCHLVLCALGRLLDCHTA